MSGGKKARENEGKAEMLGDAARHVGFVDEQGVEVGGAGGGWTVAKDHAGDVFYALDGEAEAGETAKRAEALIEELEGARWVVLRADAVELDAGGANTGLSVGDAEEDDLMPAPFELFCEGGHGVDVTGAGETECS
jgi:hypothetical protein